MSNWGLRKRTFVGTILSGAMVLGLVPGLSGTANAGATPMTATISDRSPVPGEQVLVGVRDCEPTSKYRLFYDGDKIRVGRANKVGNFSRAFYIPDNAPEGKVIIRVVCVNDTGPKAKEKVFIEINVRHQVLASKDPTPRVSRGSSYFARGGGCMPGSWVRIWVNGQKVRTLFADSDGKFGGFFPIPRNTELGRGRINTVCERDYPPGSKLILEIYVRVVR